MLIERQMIGRRNGAVYAWGCWDESNQRPEDDLPPATKEPDNPAFRSFLPNMVNRGEKGRQRFPPLGLYPRFWQRIRFVSGINQRFPPI
jgi:hypothetical protein